MHFKQVIRKISVCVIVSSITFWNLPVLGATLKVLHIRNPFKETVNDMRVTHFSNTKGLPMAVVSGGTGFPSNTFSGVSGTGTKTLSFAGDGSLKEGQQDHYKVMLEDDVTGFPFASNIVTKVEFSIDGNIVYTITRDGVDFAKDTFFNGFQYKAGDKLRGLGGREVWKKNVAGFTNEEFFDFSDPNNAFLNILNTEADLNIRYTLFDLKAFTNVSLSKFNLNNFQDVNTDNLVYSNPELIIEPGSNININLGSILNGTYALATIGTLKIQDLDTGEEILYEVPQAYGQDFEKVPEPSLVMGIFALGTVGLGSRLISKKK